MRTDVNVHRVWLRRCWLVLCLATLPFTPAVLAQDGPALVVGTRIAPPFVIANEDGSLSGISIELWRRVAEALNLSYEFERRDLAGLITGLEDGTLSVSVAALTVTAERETRIDFTHPFHTTGLAIAVPAEGDSVFGVFRGIFSWEFFLALVALGGLLLLVGLILWIFERKKNPGMFGGSLLEGIGASFWWAAVTMTTVGYGDKAAITLAGRIVGLVWMFAAIILISGFTAAIATSLTVGRLDLPNVRVLTVANSSSAAYLDARGIRYAVRSDVTSALAALGDGGFDALVYDKPILQYLSNREYPRRTDVLPAQFERQDYAIALPTQSDLREPMNQMLLSTIRNSDWQQVLTRYLGHPDH